MTPKMAATPPTTPVTRKVICIPERPGMADESVSSCMDAASVLFTDAAETDGILMEAKDAGFCWCSLAGSIFSRHYDVGSRGDDVIMWPY